MVRRLERLLEIDALIRSGERHTAQTLGVILERSERTIRSDIAFLRDRFGAPIEFIKIRGYYYSDPSWSLPTMPLS